MSQDEPPPEDPRVHLARNRTNLANFRTGLALDRTTLAWVRTTLAMASFGFGLVAFFRSLEEKSPTAQSVRLHQGAIGFGVALVLLGIVATLLAAGSHWLALSRLRRGETPELKHVPLSIAVAATFVVFSLVGLWALWIR